MQSRFFRFLVRLFPEETRSLYAREMQITFESERRASGGRISLLRLWMATLIDLFRTAPSEHLDIARRDLRYSIRVLRKSPGQTLAATATLALAMGANLAMFAIVDGVLFDPLPHPDAQQLVQVFETNSQGATNLGFETFDDLRARSRDFRHLVAVGSSTATFSGGEQEAERVPAMRVSHDYFEMLGVRPELGRDFSPFEDAPGDARRVVVLSHALFERRFGGDPDIVGKAIEISGREYRVNGVLPPDHRDLIAERLYLGAEVWYPLGYDASLDYACRSCRHLAVFGRLRAQAELASAERELSGLMAGLEREHAVDYHEAAAALTPLREVFVGGVRPALLVLWGGVAALLLVACANVANLVLLRASERESEVRVRTALGVTPGRLTRHVYTETLLFSTIAGALSLAFAAGVLQLLPGFAPKELPRLSAVGFDGGVWLLAVLLVPVSAFLFSLAPLRLLARRGLTSGPGTGRTGDLASTWRLRSAFVICNVALATALLVGSGLLIRTVQALLDVELGFEPEQVLTLQIWGTGPRFSAETSEGRIAATVRYYDDVLTRIESLPGVEAAAGATNLPLGGNLDAYSIHVVGRELPNPEEAPNADRFVVTPRFFEAMRIGLLEGRHLSAADSQTSQAVAVINERAARELFAGEPALGQQVRLGPQDAAPRKIVGVVPDVRHHGLDVAPNYQVYVPQAQWAWAESFLTLVVRSSGDPTALVKPVRDVVRTVDPTQAVSRLRTYEEIVASVTATRRFAASLLTVFAALALTLAMVGSYAAVAVLVGQRRREIGLRIALGARARAIRAMVLSRGMGPVAAGLLAGLLMAAVGTRALRSLVFGVDLFDPLVFLGSTILLVTAGLIACALPAWRAARIDPVENLRSQ